jgi:transglutaminase-like putative cysteine protease
LKGSAVIFRHIILPLGLCAALCAAASAADSDPKLDPTLPYQAKKSNPVTYTVDFRVIITPPYHSKVLKVWLPLPQSDAGQEVAKGEFETFPMKVEPKIGTEKVFGNTFAYFEFDHPEGAQIIRHTFKVKVWELRWDIDPKKVARVEKWPEGFDRYLRSEQTVVVDDRFRDAVKSIVPKPQGAANDLAAVMDWVNQRMTYDHGAASLKADAVHALQDKRGHCSDYHGLCAALGRALGYPTRVTYGINPFPKNSPSHCKMEAYLPPYGWVSFDVSETQNLVNLIKKDTKLDEKQKEELTQAAVERMRRGYRDNTWFLQTRGSDYDVVPPARKKVPVVRTVYVEADGEALPDTDSADPKRREFGWMTSQRFVPDTPVTYPFKDLKSLPTSR